MPLMESMRARQSHGVQGLLHQRTLTHWQGRRRRLKLKDDLSWRSIRE